MKKWFLFVLLFFPSGVLASSASKPIILTCPKPSELKKDTKSLTWYTGPTLEKADFKSYDTSFAKKIKSFGGAQWQGVKIGKIQCVYIPKNQYTFSVVLYFEQLAKEPTSGQWGTNQGGYRNCLPAPNSDKDFTPSSCQFEPLTASKESNPYQELDDLKAND